MVIDKYHGAQIPARLAAGELLPVLMKENKTSPDHGQDQGTVTQILRYVTAADQQTVAIVRQFVRPNGALGASGQPTPKDVRLGPNQRYLSDPGCDIHTHECDYKRSRGSAQ
jgi:hypothetical protein